MMVLITYDVSTVDPAGARRLRRVAKLCVNHGQRVQNSVFECLVNPAQLAELKHRLLELIDPEKDSIRIYSLGAKWDHKVEQIGRNDTYNPEGTLIL